MTDHETTFACQEQEAAIRDAEHFVRYMASPELFDHLDMDHIEPLEGRGTDRNLHIHTTRLITNYMDDLANKALGIELYKPSDTPTYIKPTVKEEEEEGDEEEGRGGGEVHVFGSQYAAHHQERQDVKANLMKHLVPSEPINEQDMIRETITIRHESKPLHIKIRIENYVYVTYLSNTNDPRKRCKINLLDMASKTLMFGIQHSKNKFSKNDLRYRWGSHLVFESGVLVETGSTNPLLAAKLLEHTMNIFRYVCGYYNIGIWERRCHNVVATGSLNFGICPDLLKDRYPYVTYEKKNFAGVIICINDIDAWGIHNNNNNNNNTSNHRQRDEAVETTIFDDLNEFVKYYKNTLDHADDYNRKYNNIGSEAEQRERDLIQCNLAVPTLSSTPYEVMYDEFDITHVLRGNKEKNVKALVFPRGRVICVGNKSREGVIEAYTKLFSILESVRDTPENIKEEKRIINMRRYNYARKVKKDENDDGAPPTRKRKKDKTESERHKRKRKDDGDNNKKQKEKEKKQKKTQ